MPRWPRSAPAGCRSCCRTRHRARAWRRGRGWRSRACWRRRSRAPPAPDRPPPGWRAGAAPGRRGARGWGLALRFFGTSDPLDSGTDWYHSLAKWYPMVPNIDGDSHGHGEFEEQAGHANIAPPPRRASIAAGIRSRWPAIWRRAAVIGRDFLGTRVVAYRDAAGKPVVQSAWCPHLGADLSVGQIVDGRLRCAYHHWSFDGAGACAHIPTGDKIPSAARIFTYPSEEAWGLIWAFNGECPDFPLPRIPGAERDDDRLRSARARPIGRGTPGSRCPTASTSSTCAPCTGCRRRRCPSSSRSSRRHRVPGRKPVSPAARPHHRHQHLRAASAGSAATTCSCCSAARRSSPARSSRLSSSSAFRRDRGRAPARREGHGRPAERRGRAGAQHHPLPPRPADRVGPPPRAYFKYVEEFPCFVPPER